MSRRQPATIAISMFPFLSVLCTMIGVLILFLLVILSTRAVGKPGPGVDSSGKTIVMDAGSYRAKAEELRQLASRLQNQQAECERLERMYAAVQGLIQTKEREGASSDDHIRFGEPLGEKDAVAFVPDRGVKSAKKPITVEVTAHGFVVHPEKTRYPIGDLQSGRKSTAFVEFLQGVDRKCDQQYLLLLVHPNGARSYHVLRNFLKATFPKKVRVPGVKEPVVTSRIGVGVEPCWYHWQVTAGSEKGEKR